MEDDKALIEKYPPEPTKPLDTDCCGSGCSTCVFDLYDLDMKKWRKRCDEIDENVVPCAIIKDIISIYEFKYFKIIDINSISSAVKIFTFQIDGNRSLPLECGQHIVARAHSVCGKTIIRPYTPVSKRTDKGYFKIAVKFYESGEMSCCMRAWRVDNEIEWRGPFGEFIYKAKQYDMLLLLAGGTGVTPMIQIMHEVLDNEDDFTRIILFYSVREIKDMILKDDMNEWNSYWNCDIVYCLTGDDRNIEKMKYGDKIHYGRIDSECLSSFISEELPLSLKVLICGSKCFNEDMTKLVMNLYGIAKDKIHCFL